MSLVHSFGKSGEGSTLPTNGSSLGSSSGVSDRVPIRSLVVLGLLLGGNEVLVVYRALLVPVDDSFGEGLVVASIGGVTRTDLVSTKANPAQPQVPSPFRFAEIAQQA